MREIFIAFSSASTKTDSRHATRVEVKCESAARLSGLLDIINIFVFQLSIEECLQHAPRELVDFVILVLLEILDDLDAICSFYNRDKRIFPLAKS